MDAGRRARRSDRMTKGRRTNNRHKRKRLPPGDDSISRGHQSGALRTDESTKYDRPNLEEVLSETDTFLDKLRKRFRRKAR
jgi:hypothetical protein